jgi:hypothetical protein
MYLLPLFKRKSAPVNIRGLFFIQLRPSLRRLFSPLITQVFIYPKSCLRHAVRTPLPALPEGQTLFPGRP